MEGDIKSKYTTKLIIVVLEIFPTNLREFKCIIFLKKKNYVLEPSSHSHGSWKFCPISLLPYLYLFWILFYFVLFLNRKPCPKTMQYFNVLSLLNLLSFSNTISRLLWLSFSYCVGSFFWEKPSCSKTVEHFLQVSQKN